MIREEGSKIIFEHFTHKDGLAPQGTIEDIAIVIAEQLASVMTHLTALDCIKWRTPLANCDITPARGYVRDYVDRHSLINFFFAWDEKSASLIFENLRGHYEYRGEMVNTLKKEILLQHQRLKCTCAAARK